MPPVLIEFLVEVGLHSSTPQVMNSRKSLLISGEKLRLWTQMQYSSIGQHKNPLKKAVHTLGQKKDYGEIKIVPSQPQRSWRTHAYPHFSLMLGTAL